MARQLSDYKTLEELQASEKLKTVTDKFTSPQFGNSAGFTGEDVFSEFTITAKEKITLGENKLYFVVQTEPQTYRQNIVIHLLIEIKSAQAMMVRIGFHKVRQIKHCAVVQIS